MKTEKPPPLKVIDLSILNFIAWFLDQINGESYKKNLMHICNKYDFVIKVSKYFDKLSNETQNIMLFSIVIGISSNISLSDK